MNPRRLPLAAALLAALFGGKLEAVLLYHYTFDLNGGTDNGLQDSGLSGSPNPLLLGPAGSIVTDCVRIGDGALRLDTALDTDETPVSGINADPGYDGAYSTNAIEPGAFPDGDLLTITAWIRAEDSGQEASATMIGLGSNPDNGARSTLRFDAGTPYLRHEIEGANTIASGGPVLDDTLWHHLAMVIDPRPRTGTTETDDAIQNDVVLYIDGERYSVTDPAPFQLTGNNAETNLTALEFGLGQIRIGDGVNDAARDFNGYIDDVRVYDEALDDAAILALAEEPGAIVSCFMADRVDLFVGEIVTLEWDAFDFETLTLTNDQNADTVDLSGRTDPATGRGTLALAPVNGIYTITGTRSGGGEMQSVSLAVNLQTAPDVTAAAIPSITDGTAPVEVCWAATSISSGLVGELEALTATTATDADRDFGSLLVTPQDLSLVIGNAILSPTPIPVTGFLGSDLTLASDPYSLLQHSEANVNREYEAYNVDAQIASGLDNTRWADANAPANAGNNGAAYLRDNTGTLVGRDPVVVDDPSVPLITLAYESGPDIGYASVWEGGQLDGESASDFAVELWFQPNSLVAGGQILLEWGGSGRGSYLAFVDDEIVLQMDADTQGSYTLPDVSFGDTPIILDYDVEPGIVTSGAFESELNEILIDSEADFDTVLNDPDAVYLLDITSGPASGQTAEVLDAADNVLTVRGAGLGAGAGATYEIRKASLPWTQVVARFQISNNNTADDTAEIYINGSQAISVSDLNLNDIAGNNGGGIGGQFGTIGQNGPVVDNQASSFFDGKIAVVRVHDFAIPESWIVASYLETTGGTPDLAQQALIEAEVQNSDYTLNWLIQPDTITINDGSTDVLTTSDPAEIAGGCYEAGVVGTNTTYTVTASFTGGESSSSTVTVTTGSDGSSYEEVIRADGPIGYYRFEEEAGSIAIFDYSGNRHHSIGTIGMPGLGMGSPGAIGNSWGADGASGWRIPVPLNPQDPDNDDDALDLDADGLEGFTLEALIRPDDARANANQVIFQQEDGNGTGRSALSLDDQGRLRTFYGGFTSFSDDTALSQSWSHVALTAIDNGIDYTIHFYIDGQPAEVDDIFLGVDASTGAWRIGVDKTSGTFWGGSIDEVAFYDYPLDDPNFDEDQADSLLPGHVASAIANTELLLLGFGAQDTAGSSDGIVADGDQVTLVIKVGANATSVEVDNGVGSVTPVDGFATIMVSPPLGTTTYTVTVNGTDTFAIDLIALPPIAVSTAGVNGASFFEVTAVNLVPGLDYDLSYSLDLVSEFTDLNVFQTADVTGILTFEDPIPFDPALTPRLFYRVTELEPAP